MSGNEPVPNFGIAGDFPLLWEIAQQYDFAERLGGSIDPLWTEVDAALRELWLRRNLAAAGLVEQRSGQA